MFLSNLATKTHYGFSNTRTTSIKHQLYHGFRLAQIFFPTTNFSYTCKQSCFFGARCQGLRPCAVKGKLIAYVQVYKILNGKMKYSDTPKFNILHFLPECLIIIRHQLYKHVRSLDKTNQDLLQSVTASNMQVMVSAML